MDQQAALDHSLASLIYILLLIFGLLLNLGALTVFCDVPKLLKSTINTLVRNLFVVHCLSIITIGSLIMFDWISWTYHTVDDKQSLSSSFRDYRFVSNTACCPVVRFFKGTSIMCTFVILWIMVLDRAMTIAYPKHPRTLLLKRNPTLSSCFGCLLAPLCQSYHFLLPSPDVKSGNCNSSSSFWNYFRLTLYSAQVIALLCVCLTLIVKLSSAPPKYSTKVMKRIVLLVEVLVSSYVFCTAPQKICQMFPASEMLSKMTEVLLLMPVVVHPILYYLISINFRKAIRRSVHRRTFVPTSRQCKRQSENMNAALTSCTAFSITSDETLPPSTLNVKQIEEASHE